jgi:hypothetical protein
MWFILFASYVSMVVVGIPLSGVLIHQRSLLACSIAGATTAVVPVLLLMSLSLFSGTLGLGFADISGFVGLALAGVIGGSVFWLIAFAKN